MTFSAFCVSYFDKPCTGKKSLPQLLPAALTVSPRCYPGKKNNAGMSTSSYSRATGSPRISHFLKPCSRLECRFYSTQGVSPPAAFIKNCCTKSSSKKQAEMNLLGKPKCNTLCFLCSYKDFELGNVFTHLSLFYMHRQKTKWKRWNVSTDTKAGMYLQKSTYSD